jgi:copper resistance protein B
MNLNSLLRLSYTLALGLCASLAASAAESAHSGHASGGRKTLPPGWEPAVHDSMIHTFTLFEKAEFRSGDTPDAAVLDAQGWVGGDFQRFWWKAEVEQEIKGAKAGEFEVQGLYSRLVSPFWDFQTGVRIDRKYSGSARV